MKWIALAILGLIVVFAVWVRAAPYDAEVWHRPTDPRPAGDYPSAGGFLAVREITAAPDAVLSALDTVAAATVRTTRMSGAPQDGMVTYRTRSALWGFPDYTTVATQADPDTGNTVLVINARLQFGQSDMGVNRARVQGWLDALGPLTVQP